MGFSYISREGYEKLRKELDYLTRVKRKEIAKDIETARSHGDLRENAEYDAAKEMQAMNEIRIAQLTQQLSTLHVMDGLDIPEDKVYLGATVHLKDLISGEEMVYTLVSEAESDFLQNKISVTSPIGRGLLGKSENETAEIQVPAGLLKYQVLKITR
ncbi:transcription elongation factor GreA [bacterium]|nr:transcription elongation factor GreA [bacterium]